MPAANVKLPHRTDCRHYDSESKTCRVLTETYCAKKHECGFHQDEEAKRLPEVRAKAHEALKNKKSPQRNCHSD